MSIIFQVIGSFWGAMIASVVVFALLEAMKLGQKSRWKAPVLCTLIFINVFFHLFFWQWPSIRLDVLLGQ